MKAQIEGLQPPQHGQADAAGGNGAEMHALYVIAAGDAVGDVPPAVYGNLVGRQVIADQRQHHHHDVFRHADAVGAGHLGDRDVGARSCIEIDVIGANAGCEGQLQLLCLVDPLLGQIGRPERLGDDHFRIGQMFLEFRVRTILVACHNQLVTVLLHKAAKTQLARDTTDEFAGLETEGALRGRGGLTIRIAGDRRDAIPGIVRWISSFRVGIENT
jgi:hypothetical protein